MAQRKPVIADDDRGRELRKISEQLLALADEVETKERHRDWLHDRQAMKSARENRCSRVASGLLMDTLAFGGPFDEKLRSIVLSWCDKPEARMVAFNHVCEAWRPVKQAFPSTSNLLDCANALRMIAGAIVPSAE